MVIFGDLTSKRVALVCQHKLSFLYL